MEDIKNDEDKSQITADENLINLSIEKSKTWIRFLLSKWLIIVCFGLAGIVLGVIYAKRQVRMYESYLTFSLDENGNSSGGGIASLAAQFGFGNSENDLFSGDNIVEVIKSRTILERVLLSKDTLEGKPITMIDYFSKIFPNQKIFRDAGKKQEIVIPDGLDRNRFTPQQNDYLYKIYQDIQLSYLTAARPDKQLNIYVVKFISPNERFTKIFTDRILNETIKFYTELKTQKSEATLKVLEQRIADVKGNLNASISTKASSQDANLNPAFAAALVPLQKQQLNMQVYGAAYAELYKNLELARFQYLQNIPLLQIINQNDYPMAKVESNWIKSAMIGAVLFGIFGTFLFSIFHLVGESRKK